MASRGSTGDGVKGSKLHESEIQKYPEMMKRCKYLNKSKYPPETKKKQGKYMETKKRITKLRGLLEKLQEDFKENKRVNKICKQFDKLQAKDEISVCFFCFVFFFH